LINNLFEKGINYKNTMGVLSKEIDFLIKLFHENKDFQLSRD